MSRESTSSSETPPAVTSAFSNPSVLSARLLLFFGIAFAITAALVLPVIRLNRRRAAREAETKYPQFEERLLTFTERVEQNANDPFLHLLADDTLSVAQQTQPKEVAKTSWLFSFSSAAAIAAAILLWLGLSGPGFLGYGTSLLWGGLPKGDMKPFYDIDVAEDLIQLARELRLAPQRAPRTSAWLGEWKQALDHLRERTGTL